LSEKSSVLSSQNLFDPDARIVVLGDIILDGYASGEVERISPEAPVPVLRHLSNREVAGGAANVAVNISALGGRAQLVGLVGEDQEAKRLKMILDAAGVHANLMAVPDRPTTSKLRMLAGRHQMLRIDREDASDAAPATEQTLIRMAADLLPGARALVLSDYKKGCLTDNVLRATIAQASLLGVPVFVDPKRSDFGIYAGAAFITPNRSELKAATGVSCDDRNACRRAARIAIDVSNATIVLTRSERGMALFSPDGMETWLPTNTQEVFDVSGAGDTVIATLAYAVASGMNVTQALRVANCAAGLVIGKSGTATTNAAEICEALQQEHRPTPPRKGSISLEDAEKIRTEWKKEELIVGFTNGCFDLIHPGHIALLREASQQCDRLVVGLNSDASVKRLKGDARPIQDDRSRAEVMSAISYVDLVVIFDEDTPLRLIEELRPDVLIKGSDYEEHEIVGADLVKGAGGSVVRVNVRQGHSTSDLVARSRQPEHS
jgi:D-beta-D-heptose 7-phosphate kinase/D-beta-D-heptose 1-phosphate adenosyltransferase